MLLAIAASCQVGVYAKIIIPEGDSIVMRREADAFIEGMPDGLQIRQAKAVEKAIHGDFTLLNEVRNSRNAQPEYSANVETREISIAGRKGRAIPSRLYLPKDPECAALPLLIYFHGGGWTFGSLNSCSRFCDAIASTGKAGVLAVDYALAPEYPYPEGLNDCMDAVEYVFENYRQLGADRNSISLGGDSSGGNLALAAALRNADTSRLPIKSLILFYPVVKAENDGSDSWMAYGEGYGLDSILMDKFNEAYIPADSGKKEETISPVYASDLQLGRLPRILMVNAERDILASQGEAFALRLRAAGCEIEHVELPGTVHLFITVAGQNRAFLKSVEYTESFITQ